MERQPNGNPQILQDQPKSPTGSPNGKTLENEREEITTANGFLTLPTSPQFLHHTSITVPSAISGQIDPDFGRKRAVSYSVGTPNPTEQKKRGNVNRALPTPPTKKTVTPTTSSSSGTA